MEHVVVKPNVDLSPSDLCKDVPEGEIIHIKGGPMEVVGIPRATEEGQVTVAWIALLPDSTPVVLETTFALLHSALRGIAAANDIDLETNRVRGT